MTFSSPSAQFPSSVVTDSDVGVASNREAWGLDSAIGSGDSSLMVDSSISGAPSTGILTINDERIKYTSKDDGTNTFSGLTRGFDGSTAASHSAGATVALQVTAHHHNALLEEVKAVQTEVGASGSQSFVRTDGTEALTANWGVGGFDITNIGTAQADTLEVINAGAGTNPTLTSNDAGQLLTLTGNLNVSGTITEAGNAVPNATDGLDFFAATTSAELAGVISDETGTGSLVFGTSPSLGTPTITQQTAVTDITLQQTTADYTVTWDDPAAARAISIPDPGGTDVLVFEAATQTLTNKTINADNNTVSNLAHGAEVDNPSSGVHGVTGNVVGTTDTQTLTNKTLDGDTLSGTTTYTNAGLGTDPTLASNAANQVLTLTGRLGIGESAAAAPLHVTNDQAALTEVRLDNSDVSGSMAYTFYDGSNERAGVNYDTAAALLDIRTTVAGAQVAISTAADTEAVRIDASQNVDIVTGALNMAAGGNIQDTGTDAIQFDGTQNVTVPNGSLTLQSAGSLVLPQTTANYTVSWNDPAAGRTLTIPDPGGADTFTFNAASQTLTNKTIDPSANTIDGDVLDITFTPSNYSPDASPAEAADVDDLAAHLKGIDTELATTASPGGADTNVQFNDAGSFGGSANFTWDDNTLFVQNTQDAASVEVLTLEGNRATVADNDEAFIGLGLSDSGGTQTEFARITWVATDVTDTTEDGAIAFDTIQAGSLTEAMRIDGGNVGIGTSVPTFDLNGLTGIHVKGDGATLQVDATGNKAAINFTNTGTTRYVLGVNTGDNQFTLLTTDSDGSGTNADVIRIPNGQLTVDGNATFDDNAFDYVCQNRSCGWSAGVWNDDTPCPRCGSTVEWHDDLALLTEVVTGGQSILNTSEDAMDRMEALGVLKRDDEGQVFIGFQKAHLYSFSALSQAHRRIQALENALDHAGIPVPDAAT